MNNKENIVTFGLEKVHYSKATYDAAANKYTYSTPVAIPGAVNLSLPAQGSVDPFYADNVAYYLTETNNGYAGSLELAKIPKSFKEDILGEEKGLENAETVTSEFALMFEFAGDSSHTRYVVYRNKAGRPEIKGATTTDKKTPQTETLSITSSPRINDKYVKAYVEEGDGLYSNFFEKVCEPEEIKSGTTEGGGTTEDPSGESQT